MKWNWRKKGLGLSYWIPRCLGFSKIYCATAWGSRSVCTLSFECHSIPDGRTPQCNITVWRLCLRYPPKHGCCHIELRARSQISLLHTDARSLPWLYLGLYEIYLNITQHLLQIFVGVTLCTGCSGLMRWFNNIGMALTAMYALSRNLCGCEIKKVLQTSSSSRVWLQKWVSPRKLPVEITCLQTGAMLFAHIRKLSSGLLTLFSSPLITLWLLSISASLLGSKGCKRDVEISCVCLLSLTGLLRFQITIQQILCAISSCL